MNDQDYFKEGVELADGWVTYKDADYFLGANYFACHAYDDAPQPVLDALAAQLVRQIPKPYGIWQYPIGVSISSMDLEDGRELSKVEGPDRTMNTIKAIVDSKVLLGS